MMNKIQAIVFATLVGLAVWAAAIFVTASVAGASPSMCGITAPYGKTLTVSIDPDMSAAGVSRWDVLAAFDRWNALWIRYHGFPIFAESFDPDWRNADVLLTAHGTAATWVATRCTPGFEVRGNNESIVFMGTNDAYRNSTWLVHELGHALGFPDFVSPAYLGMPGYIGPRSCNGYIGIMSYCAPQSTWLLDWWTGTIMTDVDLVWGYYQ